MIRHAPSRLLRAALLCAVIDGLFSSVLTLLYGRTVISLFERIAVTAFGPAMNDAGATAALLGLATHFGVALTWSAVFLVLVARASWLRRVLATRYGVLKVAAVYGPAIWIVMSMIVIPLATRQAPAITYRWWIQLVGHGVFVGMPIVGSIGRTPMQ